MSASRVSASSAAYARALQVVALVIAAVILGRQAAGGFPSPEIGRRLLQVRLAGAGVAVILAALCTPRRSVAALRWFAYLIGVNTAATILVLVAVEPDLAWEEVSALVALFLGASVFMPWAWQWQASFVAVVLAGSALVVATFETPGTLPTPAAIRLFVTLVGIGAASVMGTVLQQRARARVAASEARYRGLFQQAGDGIAVLDAAGAIHDANPRLGELLGRPADQLIGRRLGDFLAPVERASLGADAHVTAEYQAALGGALRTTVHTLLRSDGRPVEVEIAYARTETIAGPVVQAVLRDLTARRAVERQHAQAQKLDSLGRFAGGIVHQFNNLLGGILTHAGVLRADATNQAAARELDEILAATRRGRELTRELLRFTRSTPLTVRPVAAAELLASAMTLARTALPDEVAIETAVAPDCPALAVDPDRLAEAFVQLALNAREALRGPGKVRIEAAPEAIVRDDARWPGAQPGTYVRISVSDTGIGMDAATVERVLEPFFTTKPLHQAVGLGLSTVHGIVRDHGGTLRIDSARGRGTTVHMLIPAATVAPAAGATPSPPTAPPGGGATVLIVDDEEIVRSSLRRALTRFGYRVLEAADGPTALAAVQSAAPPVELVVLDLVLPGGGAGIFELLKAVRPELKVLISSGYTPDSEAARGLAPRVDGFLQKPFELPELRAAVARALGR
jgi:PAS domain S-box-containing protein